MQVCPWCAAGVHRISAEPSPRSRMHVAALSNPGRDGDVLYGETVLETALTSTVIGLTVQFITFLFLLSSQQRAALPRNILYSSLAGLLAGMVAFALIRTWDATRATGSLCVRCGLRLSQ